MQQLLQPTVAPAQQPTDTVTDGSRSIEQLAMMYWFGEGDKPVDHAEAFRLLEQGVEAQRPLSQFYLALRYRSGEAIERNAEREFALFQAAASSGVAGAQSFLGWAYLTGGGVKPDYAKARDWFTAAARQEDPLSLHYLSAMYRRGTAVERNVGYAVELLTRSAELGYPPAKRELGMDLIYDQTDRRDVDRGLYFLEAAALDNDLIAALNLGLEYLSANNTERDLTGALRWLSRAAERDDPLASLWLAELYEKGFGVEVDQDRAVELRESALARANPSTTNEFAWDLSVHRDSLLRNGTRAVAIMEDLLRNPSLRTPAYLDTLAAAYAETGRFEKAVDAQLESMTALPASTSDQVRAAFRARLDVYRAGEAYHE